MITYDRKELDGRPRAYFTGSCKNPCGYDIAGTHFPLILASGSERLTLEQAKERAEIHQYDLGDHHNIFVEGWIASPDPSQYDDLLRVPFLSDGGLIT